MPLVVLGDETPGVTFVVPPLSTVGPAVTVGLDGVTDGFEDGTVDGEPSTFESLEGAVVTVESGLRSRPSVVVDTDCPFVVTSVFEPVGLESPLSPRPVPRGPLRGYQPLQSSRRWYHLYSYSEESPTQSVPRLPHRSQVQTVFR